MSMLAANGIDIYYEEHGDPAAEPVLLIMGYAGNTGSWAPQIPALAERYHVVTFDNRGAGRTTQAAERYTMQQFVDDAVAVMDATGASPAHVIGQSMGGMIAQQLVLRHPERVRSLVLACTTPGGSNAFGWSEIAELSQELDNATDLASLMTPEALQTTMDLMFTPECLQNPTPALIEMGIAQMQYPSTLDGLRGQVAAVLGHDVYDRLPEIRVPTLVITGADDTMVDARNATLLAERIPGARLRVFPGVRHGFMAEIPDAVNTALLDFLAQHAAVAA